MKAVTINPEAGSITARGLAVILALNPKLTAADVVGELVERAMEQGLGDPQFLQETGQYVLEGIQRKSRLARRSKRTGKAVAK